MRARIVVFLLIFQSTLGFAHWFIYRTWTDFRAIPDPPGITGTQATLALLAVSFVVASLLAFRYFNRFVRFFYTIAAVWLGAVNFLFLAACLSWIIFFGVRAAGMQLTRPATAAITFGLAAGATETA